MNKNLIICAGNYEAVMMFIFVSIINGLSEKRIKYSTLDIRKAQFDEKTLPWLK